MCMWNGVYYERESACTHMITADHSWFCTPWFIVYILHRNCEGQWDHSPPTGVVDKDLLSIPHYTAIPISVQIHSYLHAKCSSTYCKATMSWLRIGVYRVRILLDLLCSLTEPL